MSGKNREEISLCVRKIIIDLHKKGKSYREIGDIVNRPKSSVQKVVNRFKREKRIRNKVRSGRPRKLTTREERKIVKMVKKDPRIPATKIAATLMDEFGITVSAETVRRTLKKAGYRSRVARRKPYISKINQKKRLDFARSYKNKNIDFWEKVIFSDESKFNIFGSDGRILIWRKPGEEWAPKNLQGTIKHGGGGVMVWGCMSAAGVGNLVIIEGVMDKTVYLNILKENLKKSAEKLEIGSNYYFQQDNDPKHTAHTVRLWILYNTPHTLPTPPQSPDMNPIEHVWNELEKRLRSHHITNKTQLKELLLKEWENIEPDFTRKLVESMPRRLEAVLKSKGNATRY